MVKRLLREILEVTRGLRSGSGIFELEVLRLFTIVVVLMLVGYGLTFFVLWMIHGI